MATSPLVELPHDVADKVLRRARVSKMARALQDRLALANIKITRGWQDRSIDSIEPELELELKRKRTSSNADLYSDTSSSVSGRCFSAALPTSSPITNPVFSDEINRSGSSQGSVKRLKIAPRPASAARPRARAHLAKASTTSWKSTYQLPESSPINRHYSRAGKTDFNQVSFASETSTVLDSSSVSEDDDQDIPLHSFQFDHISSSPPRTPPPDIARSARLRSKSFNTPGTTHYTHPGKEGADLLLYLAASPSPAMRDDKASMLPPATPPSKNTPLPSSMMSTPGGQMFLGFGPNTPSAGFNFADFVNVTPSPAQGTWNKTPAQLKTPVATRETRRRLTFDDAATTPNLNNHLGISPRLASNSATRGSSKKSHGLGMELGGSL